MPDPVYYDPRRLKATAPPPVSPAPKPNLTGFSLSPTSSRTRPPASPSIAPQGGKDPVSLALGAAGYDHIEGNGPKALWMKRADRSIVSQEEALAAIAPFEQQLIAQGFIPIPGRPGVYYNPQSGKTVNLADKDFGGPGGGSGDRGFAPQAKSSGTLANGQPYIFDPNLPAGQQFYNGLTGASLTPEEFKSVPKQQVSPITGNLLLIDDFGNVTDTGKKIGFAGTDPALTAAEDKRRFDVGEGGLNARSAADREAANQRSLLGAQTAGFQTVANLTPQLATAALNQAQFQRDVISSPADLAYRMFSTRGGTSPFPRVTQADLINNLASEIELYNQVLQAFRPGPVGFQPAPQAAPQTPAPTGFTAPAQAAPSFVEDGGSVAPVGGISPLTRAGTPSFVTGGSPATIPPPPPGLSNPELWAQFAAGMQPQAAPQAAPQVVPQAVPQAAQQQTGFSVAPPTFQIPQIPVPQRTTQSEIRGFEQQTRPPAVQSILEGRMPKPLDLGFQLPTPMQYGALTPDERKAFGSTLAIQYDLSPEDFEDTIRRRFTAPQERRAQAVGF